MLPSGTLDGPSAIRKESKIAKSRDKLTRHSHGSGWDKQSCTLYPGETSYNLQSNQESVDLTSSVAPHSCDTSVAGDQTGCIGFGSSYVTERVDGWYGGVDELTQTENMEYTGGELHLVEETRKSTIENYKSKRKRRPQLRGLKNKLERLSQEVTDLRLQKRSTEANIRFMEEEIERVQCNVSVSSLDGDAPLNMLLTEEGL
ncbi:hypothetical protein Pmani_009413 [Petrolisthes manimaculis]|uniref:Uncharacterized protein n=1 Tax=Petrolisthes manimaculis TaxID=1843537 RepID=A0AAE1Q4B5_9EUCA|nr:hypothetical protein Pmani_009413 [Petrolisthes manimaculis]